MPSIATASTPAPTGRASRAALWALQIALAAAFVGAGGSKLAGTPDMVQLFEAVGVGQWFRYVTGVLEIGGGAMLLVPALAGLGALLLAGVMAGATLAHVFVLHTAPVPLALLAALAVVAYARRADVAGRVARLRG